MISNQILQSTVDGFREIVHAELAVCDSDGKVLSATEGMRHVSENAVQGFAASELTHQASSGMQFYKVCDEFEPEYIVAVDGESDERAMAARLFAFQLQGLVVAYKEKIDKDNFIKNLLLDNLLLVDIYNRAKKLHIDVNARRAVFTVETGGSESSVHEAIKAVFAGRPMDFVTTVDENNIVIIKEVKSAEDGYAELAQCAEEVRNAILQAGGKARIAYGTIIGEIREVSRSYKEAKLALDVGKIFYESSSIVAYNNLGIGRLIYQLPMNLCRMFIREIFDGKSPEEFDEETLATIRQFFENNLNVSETSRKLFIHRNTLVYRLDKLQKMTGLDLRVFDDAITFKIALMVVEYMEYMEKNDY
ncbi:MAG: helix-turn-helix domain-containing protein [Eubacteriales bacterium]|nr:helix-turn-helix domain-containing protein [Eubacteriales bacterium]